MSRSEAREVVELYLVAGAEPLLTEDLQDGQDIEGVRIQDPFRARSP